MKDSNIRIVPWSTLILGAILILGAYLRFDRLTAIPPSLSHDETAIAYNAYSILKTGKDEYGVPYPLLFRSFDDYKLPGMVYATVPMVALFGLTELSARLPSAIFGTLSILVMYGIAMELFWSSRRIRIGTFDFDAALLPTFMLAVSPWHINFSRQLFESNGAVFWFMLGTYFLLKSLRKYSFVLWAGLGYVIALYFYYSVRLVIPFVVLVYLVMQWKTIWAHWKLTLIALLVSIAVFLPMGREMLSPGGMERISMVSVVNDPNYLKLRDEYVQKLGTQPSMVNKVLFNRRMALGITVLENYGKNISLHNLFITGTGTYGALYKFELILIVFGILSLWSLSLFPRAMLLTWLITAFFPGAFSINQPNTLRTLIAAPVFALLSGLGIWYALKKTGAYKTPVLLISTLLIVLVAFAIEFPKFHYAYFVDNPTHNALAFGDGYKQMVSYVSRHEQEYDRIYISGYYWRPYIFYLYWNRINPSDYQRLGSREKFGKIVFTAASWDTNGIKLMDKKLDRSMIPETGKTLYILAAPEYRLHEKDFRKLEDISGVYAKSVFVAATIR